MPSIRRSALASGAVLVASTIIALLAAEWIAAEALRSPREIAAARAGIQWDGRDRLEVVLAERESDSNCFPAAPGTAFLERPLLMNGKRVIPMGGVASAKVVGCNENGYTSTFTTDEFGFNNPTGALRANTPKIFFLGDSFTQGDCLKPGETFVDRVRARRPEAINLARGGTGPLLQLAALREYVGAGDARKVVWVYYEGNDLEDLFREQRDELLVRYLERGFSQQLLAAQDLINGAVRQMVEERMLEHLHGRAKVLPNVRMLVWQARNRRSSGPRSAPAGGPRQGEMDAAVASFLKVIAAAKDEAEAKGATLLFVYLPEYYRYAGPHLSAGASRRDEVLAGLRHLGIRVVDVHARFAQHREPVSLFPFSMMGHYTSEGAALVAEQVVDALAN